MTLKDQSIKAALDCNWSQAILLNESILKSYPNDIDTLNRLGFAQLQNGEFDNAHNTFAKVIELDKTNPIAQKNIKKIEALKTTNGKNGDNKRRMMTFIEEAGKTKTVQLINLADKKTLSIAEPGQKVHLTIKRSKVFICTEENTYIGMLPHDLGVRLIEFLTEGNQYDAYLKAVEEKAVKVFIRECVRCKKFATQPSFPLTPKSTRRRRY